MADIERIAYIKDQLSIIRSYSAPWIAEYQDIFIDLWNEGKSITEIAELIEWQERSVKTKLTHLGIDWRTRPAEPVIEEPEQFVWW